MTNLPKGISCAFVFGDVNGLKRMNDVHGHEAGDVLIKTVARIMQRAQQGAGEGHVFRMGGDEFLMIVEHADGQKRLPSSSRYVMRFARTTSASRSATSRA